tara:strand:+ start:9123 stop:10199 length:1077 start_codon:yes stop_codon:yes gene_type:complete
MNNELYTSISNGNVQNSLLIATKIIFLYDKPDLIDHTYIDICSYIGTFITIKDISKLIDVINITKNIIDNDKILIKDTYLLITKLCIICDIYNKHPTAKCTNMSMSILKNKIAHIINNNELRLSNNGIMRFEGILPPHDHENYMTALKIIAIIITTIKLTDDISVDNIDKIASISNDLRLVTEFIIRKKIKLETKFNSTDDDIVWFLWGVYSILYKEVIFDNSYYLYNYEFKKKNKVTRSGLLHAISLISIYIHNKNISNGWNIHEKNVIDKIDEVAIKLYNEIKRDIIKDNPDKFEKPKRVEKNYQDGLDYINDYIPEFDSVRQNSINTVKNMYPKSAKKLEYSTNNVNETSKIITY